eukprot:6184263-Pleurochrysis_carterae.AAC.2
MAYVFGYMGPNPNHAKVIETVWPEGGPSGARPHRSAPLAQGRRGCLFALIVRSFPAAPSPPSSCPTFASSSARALLSHCQIHFSSAPDSPSQTSLLTIDTKSLQVLSRLGRPPTSPPFPLSIRTLSLESLPRLHRLFPHNGTSCPLCSLRLPRPH